MKRNKIKAMRMNGRSWNIMYTTLICRKALMANAEHTHIVYDTGRFNHQQTTIPKIILRH
jgi:hypothetical protein